MTAPAKTRKQAVPLSRHQRRERAIETAWTNGRKLLADGYRIRPTPRAYAWSVLRPGGRTTQAPEGGTVESYTVSLDRGEWHCDCPFCALHGVCKHVVGTRLYVAACAAGLSPAFDLSPWLKEFGLTDLSPQEEQR